MKTYPEIEAFAATVDLGLVTEQFTDIDDNRVACADLAAISDLMARREIYPAAMAGLAALIIDDRIERAEAASC